MNQKINIMILALVVGIFMGCGDSKQGTKGGGYNPLINDSTEEEQPTPEFIHMFSAVNVPGSIGGRLPADGYCQTYLPASLAGKETHAFISINMGDAIVDMSTNYDVPLNRKVVGHGTNTVIANSWAELLDGSIDATLEEAGVLAPASTFWSGSNADGTLAVASCSGWTSSASNVYGAAGSSASQGSFWMYSTSSGCGIARRLVCIAY